MTVVSSENTHTLCWAMENTARLPVPVSGGASVVSTCSDGPRSAEWMLVSVVSSELLLSAITVAGAAPVRPGVSPTPAASNAVARAGTTSRRIGPAY